MLERLTAIPPRSTPAPPVSVSMRNISSGAEAIATATAAAPTRPPPAIVAAAKQENSAVEQRFEAGAEGANLAAIAMSSFPSSRPSEKSREESIEEEGDLEEGERGDGRMREGSFQEREEGRGDGRHLDEAGSSTNETVQFQQLRRRGQRRRLSDGVEGERAAVRGWNALLDGLAWILTMGGGWQGKVAEVPVVDGSSTASASAASGNRWPRDRVLESEEDGAEGENRGGAEGLDLEGRGDAVGSAHSNGNRGGDDGDDVHWLANLQLIDGAGSDRVSLLWLGPEVADGRWKAPEEGSLWDEAFSRLRLTHWKPQHVSKACRMPCGHWDTLRWGSVTS